MWSINCKLEFTLKTVLIGFVFYLLFIEYNVLPDNVKTRSAICTAGANHQSGACKAAMTFNVHINNVNVSFPFPFLNPGVSLSFSF